MLFYYPSVSAEYDHASLIHAETYSVHKDRGPLLRDGAGKIALRCVRCDLPSVFLRQNGKEIRFTVQDQNMLMRWIARRFAYYGKGLEIVSVSIDSSEKKWRSFLEENGMDWISVLDDLGGKKTSKVWENYAITTIPMFLLIDGNSGEILFRENHPDLDAIFSELLP